MQIDTTTLKRMMNQALNPFWGLVPTVEQRAVYRQGVANPAGLEGGMPCWYVCDFLNLASGASDDSTFDVAPEFTLLTMMAQSSDENAGSPIYNLAAVQLYDVCSKVVLMDRSALQGVAFGLKGGGIFTGMRELTYHRFEGDNPQCYIRVTNQDVNMQNIQVGLYGVIGGNL